jgi:hypothetical protein
MTVLAKLYRSLHEMGVESGSPIEVDRVLPALSHRHHTRETGVGFNLLSRQYSN